MWYVVIVILLLGTSIVCFIGSQMSRYEDELMFLGLLLVAMAIVTISDIDDQMRKTSKKGWVIGETYLMKDGKVSETEYVIREKE